MPLDSTPVSSHKIAGASGDKLRRHALNITARIVLLNGVGSSGKSSIAKALQVITSRERDRGDRMIGLARWQYDRVHRDMKYDLEIDTCGATPSECAHLIRQKFGL